MKYTDYLNLFGQNRATVAIFSTFNFDPVFFEARILRTKALEQARRVLVFMDASEYQRMQLESVATRCFNRRYLVVPVRPTRGVFHPKLTLLLSSEAAQLICGSNNLTQAGCTHNLELLNCLSMDCTQNLPPNHRKLVHDSLRFFEAVAKLDTGQAFAMATQWLKELPEDLAWLETQQAERDNTVDRHFPYGLRPAFFARQLVLLTAFYPL